MEKGRGKRKEKQELQASVYYDIGYNAAGINDNCRVYIRLILSAYETGRQNIRRKCCWQRSSPDE